MCYFLYWLLQFPFMLVSPQKIRWLFLAKGIIVPITWLAMLIWAFVKSPGSGTILSAGATIHGSALSWAWLSALNSALGNYATLAVNIPDFTVRWIHKLECQRLITHLEIRKERESVSILNNLAFRFLTPLVDNIFNS